MNYSPVASEVAPKRRWPARLFRLSEATHCHLTDRLNRQDTTKALKLFLSILEAGVDIVTLVDRQWYSQEVRQQN
jgi:hypothetical protein